MSRFLHRFTLAFLLLPCRAALPAPPTDSDLSALLEAMAMGFTRPEMVAEMTLRVQEVIDAQEYQLAQWFRDTTHPDSLVLAAFSAHEDRFAAFQAARLDHLRARLSQDEVRGLTSLFAQEPMRRLLDVIAHPDSLTVATANEFYTVVNGYIDADLSQKAQNLEAIQGLIPGNGN